MKKSSRPHKSGAAGARPLKVLFIGNSFTARNDLPGLVAKLAEAAGERLEHELISAGGASLRRHWNKGDALAAIKRGGWDYVVLQEQSTLPIKSPPRMREGVLLFDDAIRSAGAKTVLYMTWARAHAPQTQQNITDAYTSIGNEIGARVIPAGEAWRVFLAKYDEPALHDRDQSHPALAGSFLSACAAYATLFGRDPAALAAAVDGLTPSDVKRLAAVAATVSRPRPSTAG